MGYNELVLPTLEEISRLGGRPELSDLKSLGLDKPSNPYSDRGGIAPGPSTSVTLLQVPDFWWDATRNDLITIATGVSAWTDQIAGFALTQATGAHQPVIVPNAINGRQVIRFDGISQYLISTVWTTQLDGGCSVFIVANVRFVNDTNYRPLFRFVSNVIGIQHQASNDGTSPSKLEMFSSTNNGLLRATPTAATTQGVRLVEAIVAPAVPALTLYKNGVLVGGPTGGFASIASSSADTVRLCADETGVNFSSYDICELMIYKSVVTTTVRQNTEAYLINRWAIQ